MRSQLTDVETPGDILQISAKRRNPKKERRYTELFSQKIDQMLIKSSNKNESENNKRICALLFSFFFGQSKSSEQRMIEEALLRVEVNLVTSPTKWNEGK